MGEIELGALETGIGLSWLVGELWTWFYLGGRKSVNEGCKRRTHLELFLSKDLVSLLDGPERARSRLYFVVLISRISLLSSTTLG